MYFRKTACHGCHREKEEHSCSSSQCPGCSGYSNGVKNSDLSLTKTITVSSFPTTPVAPPGSCHLPTQGAQSHCALPSSLGVAHHQHETCFQATLVPNPEVLEGSCFTLATNMEGLVHYRMGTHKWLNYHLQRPLYQNL